MSSRSLNRVELIGNLTRDPELKYTPQGAAVCNIGMATNRNWKTESGEAKEETEFHRVVAWQRLGELFSQLLHKGSKVWISGRLRSNKFTNKDGVEQYATEIVAEDMIILSPKVTSAEEPQP